MFSVWEENVIGLVGVGMQIDDGLLDPREVPNEGVDVWERR